MIRVESGACQLENIIYISIVGQEEHIVRLNFLEKVIVLETNIIEQTSAIFSANARKEALRYATTILEENLRKLVYE